MTEARRELEVRVWHATCSLEMLIGFLTGRSIAIQDKHNSSRLPRPIEDRTALELPNGSIVEPSALLEPETPTAMDTFRTSVALDRICCAMLSDVYSANTVLISWSALQTTLAHFNAKLSHWRSQLPPRLTMERGSEHLDKAPINERSYLALRSFSTSMLINRPSLCNDEDKSAAIPSQSSSSRHADFTSAVQCVVSARNLIQLFPNRPNIVQLYAATPWWCVLHFLVQAGAVLILEIGYRFVHVSDSGDSIIEDVGKVLMWLQAMSKTSHPAFRAWTALGRLLQLATTSVGKRLEDGDNVSSFLPNFAAIDQMEKQGPVSHTTSNGSYHTQTAGYDFPQTGPKQQQQVPYLIDQPMMPLYDFWHPSNDYVAQESLEPLEAGMLEQQARSELFPDADEIARMIEKYMGRDFM